MVKLKLARVGRKNRPYFRIIAIDSRKDPFGDFLEILGHFDPLRRKQTLVLKEKRIKYWLSKGAQPTDAVFNILVSKGILKGPKKPKRLKKKKQKLQKTQETASNEESKK